MCKETCLNQSGDIHGFNTLIFILPLKTKRIQSKTHLNEQVQILTNKCFNLIVCNMRINILFIRNVHTFQRNVRKPGSRVSRFFSCLECQCHADICILVFSPMTYLSPLLMLANLFLYCSLVRLEISRSSYDVR